MQHDFVPVVSRIEGITVFAPAPSQPATPDEVIDFVCPQCGGATAFSAVGGGITCSHCGYIQAASQPVVGRGASELEFTVETLQKGGRGWGLERKDLECQQCGVRTSVPAESLTHTCPFCGSNKVIQRQDSQESLRPRYLVPFKLEAEKCRAILDEWAGSSWMAPQNLRNLSARAIFTGIYLPYWTFDSVTNAKWKAEVGHTETERYFEDGEWKTRSVTRWKWEAGELRLEHDDLLVEGANRLSRFLLGKLNPFDMSQLIAYEPGFLAGMQALAYDVPLETAWETGRQTMREKTRQTCIGQASTDQIRNFKMDLDFSDESYRYILLPVYLTSYSYDQRIFQVMVNGLSGAIAGQRPVDWGRVWLAVAALLAPGLLLGLVGLLTLVIGGIGSVIGLVGFVLLVIGAVIALILLRQAYGMDDI